MRYKSLFILISVFITVQVFGQNRTGDKKPQGNGFCKLKASALSSTIEPGESVWLYADIYDSVDYTSVPVYSISWTPTSSVLYPTGDYASAHPKVTTTYTVTVNTSCGILTDTVTVNVGCAVSAGIYTSSYYCSADPGTATISTLGNASPYTYKWSTGQTSSSITGLNVGSYFVTITDSNACSIIDTISITQFKPYISSAFTTETGDTSTLYFWDPSAQTTSWAPANSCLFTYSSGVSIDPKTTTIYTVTTTGLCGISTDTVTVFIGCVNNGIGITSTSYFCSAEQGTAVANFYSTNPPYTFLWSNGQTTKSITGLTGGTYNVSITDGNGCSFSSDSVSIDTAYMNSIYIYPYFNNTNTIEPGDSILLFSMIIDSIPQYGGNIDQYLYNDTTFAYSWAPASSVSNPNSYSSYFYPKTTTTYTLTITTPCKTLTDTITVHVGGCMISTYIYTAPYYCSSVQGAAFIDIYNGVPPFTYLWSSGQTTSSITGLSEGSYSVTVTDANGCNATDIEYIYPESYRVPCAAWPSLIGPGDSTNLTTWNDSVPNPPTNYLYSWSPSANVTNPDSANTYAHPAITTTYTLTVITPCDTLKDTTVVTVNCNHYNQNLCIVTTDTSLNKNIIIWGRNNSPPNGSFNIYRLYKGWPTLLGNSSDTSLSEFIDYSSNPSSGSYSYQLSTVDSCGESALSTVNSTIYLQAIIGNNRDSLYWTPYVGFATSIYKIYRGPALNALTLADSVSGSTLSYVDSSPQPGFIYLVEAENPSGSCTPTHKFTSHSQNVATNASFSNGGIPHKPVGVQEISSVVNPSLVIGPNPSNGVFTVSYNLSKEENVDIAIVDEFGRTIYEKQFESQHAGLSKQLFNVNDFTEGVYSLRMITADGIAVKKIVLLKNK